jgi:NAD-dependent dihydropyrimidine dehydrogenase PreA subunit
MSARRKAASAPPPAEYPFAYEAPPVSGNAINGLGETKWRRAREVFHGSGARPLEWEALQSYFGMVVPLRLLLIWMTIRWGARNSNGPVARRRREFGSPADAAAHVKEIARMLGAEQVGTGPVTEDCVYDTFTITLPHAIVVAVAHDPRDMAGSPDMASGIGTMRTYKKTGRAATRLARYIRGMGWRAVAYGQSAEVLHIPLAINAGIGQLGKHGSLISKEIGTSFRLAAVFTDLPLEYDRKVDIGVEDLCAGCLRCSTDCPAGAIANTKQTVRGAEKWYVDFDKCVPYFVKTYGCGYCLEVCPWADGQRAGWLSERLLAKRK